MRYLVLSDSLSGGLLPDASTVKSYHATLSAGLLALAECCRVNRRYTFVLSSPEGGRVWYLTSWGNIERVNLHR